MKGGNGFGGFQGGVGKTFVTIDKLKKKISKLSQVSKLVVQFRQSWVDDACFWPFTPLRKSQFIGLFRV